MHSKVIRWAVLVWTILFVFLLVPIVSLYQWNVSKRPIVIARVSNPHEIWISTKSGGHSSVYAALDYNMPNDIAHCHLEKFYMGAPNTAEASATALQLAVHPYSCEEPARLPLKGPSGFLDWTIIYIGGCAGFILLAFFLLHGRHRSSLNNRSAESPKSSGASQEITGFISTVETKSGKKVQLRLPNGRRYTEHERQEDAIGLLLFMIMGVPLLFGLAMMPFWDQIGDWPVMIAINDLLAPAISQLPNVHQHAVSQRRLLVSGSAIMYMIALLQVIFLLVSKKRRFLFIESYDLGRSRFYKLLIIVWISSAVLWYIIFVNEYAIRFLAAGFGRLIYILPFLAMLVGQMTMVALLGLSRDVFHFGRRLHRAIYS
jgi:hypothetical protein